MWQIQITGPVDGNEDCELKKKTCAHDITAAFKDTEACDKAWEIYGHLSWKREAANANLWKDFDKLLSKVESILARMERRGKRGRQHHQTTVQVFPLTIDHSRNTL